MRRGNVQPDLDRSVVECAHPQGAGVVRAAGKKVVGADQDRQMRRNVGAHVGIEDVTDRVNAVVTKKMDDGQAAIARRGAMAT